MNAQSKMTPEIIGDQAAIRQMARDYADHKAFLHDQTVQCAVCQRRWFAPTNAKTDPPIDACILYEDGLPICDDCVPAYIEAVLS